MLALKPLQTISILIWLLAVLYPSVAKAQKCDYEKNEIDALTELVIKRTAPELLLRINNQPLYVKAQCIGTNKYLKLRYYRYSDASLQENREIAFILQNNEELILYPREMPEDTTSMDDYMDVSTLMVYKLSEKQYELLTSTPVIEFKYFVVAGWISKAIKKSRQTHVMDVLRCVAL